MERKAFQKKLGLASAATPEPASQTLTLAPPDDEGQAAEQRAEDAREQGYSESYEMIWNDEPLEPYTRARESLLVRLVSADAPCKPLEDLPVLLKYIEQQMEEREKRGQDSPPIILSNVVDFGDYLPTAAKLLFLCSYPPEVFDSWRGRPGFFIRQIENWTEAHIPPDRVEAACLLAQKIRYAHRQQMAIHQPNKHQHRDSGN